MKLNLYDRDLKRIAIIDEQYLSCFWSEGYNSVESFTLELVATEEHKKKIKENFYVGRSDRDSLMVIKSIEIKNNKIVLSGKQASRVLDDVAFVGTIKKGSVVDSAIKNAYTDSRGYYNLEVDESGLAIKYNHQISNKSFLELCEIMCQDTDTGFKAVRDGQTIKVKFYQPQEKNELVYSEKFGNLVLGSLTRSSSNFKNYAIVLGEGESANRTRVDVDLSEGGEKFEIIVDASDLQTEEGESQTDYIARLTARGSEKLNEFQKVFSCAFSPYSKDFGIKYDLGDILTIYLPDYDLKMQARVARFSQKSQNNKTETTIEVGNITIKR